MKDTDIAWCAGFFDGEGCVKYYRQCPHPRTGNVTATLAASIPQEANNVETLEFFQSVIGFGNMRGPYPMPNGKPQFRLIYGVAEVEKLFLILAPYLKDKKTGDFRQALMQYWSHDSFATPADYERAKKRDKKKGCPECKDKEWNGLLCFKCGYMQ